MRVKFGTSLDKQLFLLEVGKSINEADTNDDHHLFIKRRSLSVSNLKVFKKRGDKSWLPDGFKTNLSDNWHRSAEGRRFHRMLGRFIATRNTDRVTTLFREQNLSPLEIKDLSAFIREQLSFYQSLDNQTYLEMLLEEISGG